MIAKTSTRIFLSDERPLTQTGPIQSHAVFRGLQTVNFSGLHSFHDHLLAPGGSARFTLSTGKTSLLLPLSGALHYQDMEGQGHYIAAGQAGLNKTDHFIISNPFQDDYINFLQIELAGDLADNSRQPIIITYEDLNLHLNQWLPISPDGSGRISLSAILSIAKFSGRGEAQYRTMASANAVWMFVIDGAFETAGCLLHARDGLLLTGTAHFETEALSTDAIAIILECIAE